MAIKFIAFIVCFFFSFSKSITGLEDDDMELFLNSEKSSYSDGRDIKSQCDSFFKIICSTKNWERVNCTVDVAKSAEKLCTGISVAFHHKRYIVDTTKKSIKAHTAQNFYLCFIWTIYLPHFEQMTTWEYSLNSILQVEPGVPKWREMDF